MTKVRGIRMPLTIQTNLEPKGDQPKAIRKLVEGITAQDYKKQTLLGVTGSGKTYTIAQVIDKVKKPTLVVGPNKTLVAQLYGEFKSLFPSARVEYFVSFYDYYQPESYLPAKDLYIEKDFSINEEIDRLRHSTTEALATRDDVIVCATVSCIYSVGDPNLYRNKRIYLQTGSTLDRQDLLMQLVLNQYNRNDTVLERRSFRVRGDTIDIYPLYGSNIYRIEFFGDEIDRITARHPITNEMIREFNSLDIYPGIHYLTNDNLFDEAIDSIENELNERLYSLKKAGKNIEAHRLRQRTLYDLELLKEVRYCPGMENYSRHFDHRVAGDPPFTLLDHFPSDFLLVIDESHLTIPQLRGMHRGDYARKKNLVDFGFRLPSAIDNRPLRFDEFELYMNTVIFTSATPGSYEREHSDAIVEQINRPTGLVDPKIEIRGIEGQIDNLLSEINMRSKKGERSLVTTLSKKMAEELSDYLIDMGVKSIYLHHEVDTLDRIDILRDLRLGKHDVVVGINLLREGLDLPEVSLVAILDADKQGFLRSKRSLIQLMGRASRNVHGSVILYASELTEAMKEAISENNRRRQIQLDFNRKNNIEPQTVRTEVRSIVETLMDVTAREKKPDDLSLPPDITIQDISFMIDDLKERMAEAAGELNFEKAAVFRDKIRELEKMLVR